MRARRLAALAATLVIGSGCGQAETFAQHPGFDTWFGANPRSPQAASATERARLRAHRPILLVPQGAPGPLDFYRDYIAHGTLRAGNRRWTEVDRARLAAHAGDPEATFTHQPPARADPRPVAYGRVHREDLAPFGTFTFLEWHFVFRHSGLPAELPRWQETLLGVLANPRDWHQLDHYIAAMLALGPNDEPLALILQQHNWRRSYWFGRDLPAPPDGRVELTTALRSNELYPAAEGSRRHRTVRFLTADNVAWLATGHGERPWITSHDRTRTGQRVDYALRFLPDTDPFYRFAGRLGEPRTLPGRDGPPGADYNTRPAFKDRLLQLCALRWSEQMSERRLAALRALLDDPDDGDARAWLMDRCRRFIGKSIGYNLAADSDETGRR